MPTKYAVRAQILASMSAQEAAPATLRRDVLVTCVSVFLDLREFRVCAFHRASALHSAAQTSRLERDLLAISLADQMV